MLKILSHSKGLKLYQAGQANTLTCINHGDQDTDKNHSQIFLGQMPFLTVSVIFRPSGGMDK